MNILLIVAILFVSIATLIYNENTKDTPLIFIPLMSFTAIMGISIYYGVIELSIINFIYAALLYLIVGIIYSTYRWYRFLVLAKTSFKNTKIGEWYNTKYFSTGGKASTEDKILDFRPVATYHREIITSWIFLWPLSMFWYATENLFKGVYNLVKGAFDSISNKVFTD
jgi:hypothetical protein